MEEDTAVKALELLTVDVGASAAAVSVVVITEAIGFQALGVKVWAAASLAEVLLLVMVDHMSPSAAMAYLAGSTGSESMRASCGPSAYRLTQRSLE